MHPLPLLKPVIAKVLFFNHKKSYSSKRDYWPPNSALVLEAIKLCLVIAFLGIKCAYCSQRAQEGSAFY